MIKINSELPMCLLSENKRLNEYDFVLFHLYNSNPDYRIYYKNLSRFCILDNSAYEFYIKGEELNMDLYREAIDDLIPDFYILPDVLMNKDKTLELSKKFLNKPINSLSPDPMGTLQGNTPEEMVECLKEYKKLGIRAIAIPFHNYFYTEYKVDSDIKEFFEEQFGMINKDHLYAMGRIQFMRDHKDLLEEMGHVHILGSHCPIEKVFYRNFQTMDTGYPVKCGIAGEKLFEEKEKPNIIIDDFMSIPLSPMTKALIIDNIEKFRRL